MVFYRKYKDRFGFAGFLIVVITLILTIVFRYCDSQDEKTRFNLGYEFNSPNHMHADIYSNITDQIDYESNKIFEEIKIKYTQLPKFINNSFLVKVTLTNNSKLPASIKQIAINPIIAKNKNFKLEKLPFRDSLLIIDFKQNLSIKNAFLNFSSNEIKQFDILVSIPLIFSKNDYIRMDSLSKQLVINNLNEDVFRFEIDSINYIIHRNLYNEIIENTSLRFELLFFDQDDKKHSFEIITLDKKGIIKEKKLDVRATFG